jgi:uncharacterized Zn-finger protein
MTFSSTSGKAPPWVGIVAAVAIAAAGYFITKQVKSGPTRTTDPSTLVVICPACGEQFTMDAAEYAEKLAESPNGNAIVCPKCGKPAARVASQCVNPDCGKYYLRPVGGAGTDVCPYCGTARTEAQ